MENFLASISPNGRWQVLAAAPAPRSHAPLVSYQNRIYAFGGGADQFASQNSVWCYVPERNAWETRRDMPTRRSGTVAALLNDKIWVMGGGYKQPDGTFRFLDTVEIYDPQQDTWSPGPSLLRCHDYPAGAVLDGHLYVMGGHHPDATQGGPQTDPGFDFCQRLNPTRGAWEEIAPLPTPRFAVTAVVRDGLIYTLGGVAFSPAGFHNFDFFESYNAQTNTWQREKHWHLPWTAAGLAALQQGRRTYIFGGYSGDGIHNRGACYDQEADQWYLLPPMPARRAAMGIAELNGTIYLLGGWASEAREVADTLWAYTPG